MSALMGREMDFIDPFRDIRWVCEMTPISLMFGMIKLTSSILKETREGQKLYSGLIVWLLLINQGKQVDFRVDEN